MKKNNIIALNILINAGLDKKLDKYDKVGVNRELLNEEHLFRIYGALFKLDRNYAKEFVEFVNGLPTLGAEDFMCNFLRFGYNNFKSEGVPIVNCLEIPLAKSDPTYDPILDENSNFNKKLMTFDIKSKFSEKVGYFTALVSAIESTKIKK